MAETGTAEHIQHLPMFITAPGETDVLFNVVLVFVVLLALGLGNIYFRLHALPEKMAHGSSATQFQLVAILALLALFTHNNMFWIGALLLASIQLPDYGSMLKSMSHSLEKMAERTTSSQPVSEVNEASAANDPTAETDPDPALDTQDTSKAGA